MIEEVLWSPPAQRVTLTLVGDSHVSYLESSDQGECAVILLSYAEAKELGDTLQRGFGIISNDPGPAPRDAGPLTWEVSRSFGVAYSAESVRRADPAHAFPASDVWAMLDAADEEHIRRLYAENSEGGKARGIVHAVARALGVDLSDGTGDVWADENMQRVVDEASKRMDELENLRLTTAQDKAHMDFQAAEISRLIDDRNRGEEEVVRLSRRLDVSTLRSVDDEESADALRATVVRQALEITELKGESE